MSFDPASLFAQAKIAYDIAKGINSLNTTVEINMAVSKVLEILLSVQGNALAMQSQYQELLKTKNELEQKIVEFETWSETERQYDLKEFAPGVSAYAYKNTSETGDPMHWLCPNCWQDRKKSILQRRYHHANSGSYICNRCNKFVQWDNEDPVSPMGEWNT